MKTKRDTRPHSFDSLTAAAAGLKISKDVLLCAKNSGAPGFRGGRVYPRELLPWLGRHEAKGSDADKGDLEKKRLAQKIEHERWEFERAQGQWVRKDDVDTDMIQLAERIKAAIQRKFINELPPKLEGLRAAEIAARVEGELPSLYRQIRFLE